MALGVDPKQLRNVVNLGSKRTGPASENEYRITLASVILENPMLQDLPLPHRLRLMGLIDRFTNDQSVEMISAEEFELSEVKRPTPIPKWMSGFSPLDIVTGGVYQALLVIMARPGSGKTSTILSMAEGIKREHPTYRILHFQTEIPGRLLLARMSPIFERGNPFKRDDKVLTGNLSIGDMVKIVEEGPKPQVVFVDSPDSMIGSGEAENRRFDLEEIYRRLIEMKRHAELVVATSQPRRKDMILSQSSVAESWAKAWYADIIVGLSQAGQNRMQMKLLKNRFGPSNREVKYTYDFTDLTWEDPLESEDDWD